MWVEAPMLLVAPLLLWPALSPPPAGSLLSLSISLPALLFLPPTHSQTSLSLSFLLPALSFSLASSQQLAPAFSLSLSISLLSPPLPLGRQSIVRHRRPLTSSSTREAKQGEQVIPRAGNGPDQPRHPESLPIQST